MYVDSDQFVDGCCQWYGEEHAADSADAAAHCHGCQYPDSGKSQGGSDDSGVDQIAFELLQYEDEDQEDEEESEESKE